MSDPPVPRRSSQRLPAFPPRAAGALRLSYVRSGWFVYVDPATGEEHRVSGADLARAPLPLTPEYVRDHAQLADEEPEAT